MAAQEDLFMLMDDKQLRKLAILLRNQEEPLGFRINSEPDRAKFLGECNDAYDVVITLLESSIDLRNKHKANGVKKKADIAADLEDYVKYGINMGMQCIQNCGMRVSVVEKMKTNFEELAAELNDMGEEKYSREMEDLGEEVSYYKKAMWEYATNLRSKSARAKSKAYSDALKLQGIEFPALVERHKNRLGYKDEFEFLEDDDKLEVYNSIIVESGRAKLPGIYTRKRSGKKRITPGGIGSMAVTAGMVVWDIFTAEHNLEMALNAGVSLLSVAVSYAVEVAVTAAVGTVVANTQLGIILVSSAGFVVGTLVGILFAAATGAILGAIMATGGKVPTNLDNLKFYSATMPNGMALANQISHHTLDDI